MNKIFNNPQQAAASKMNIPNAANMAEKLIEGRPDLFPDSGTETKLLIMQVMINYKDAWLAFLTSDTIPEKPKSNMHPIFLEALKPFGIK
jgi:hypothetical protein